MAEYLLKFADGRGQIHQQVANAGSEKELRDRYSQQGFLIYSIKPRSAASAVSGGIFGRKKLDLEKFLIFNQQFVTLIRAGLPILKALDLLAERLTDPKLSPYIRAVRDEVRGGSLLSDAFRAAGLLPQDLRHLGNGRREERQPGGSAGPLYHLSAPLAGGPQKGDGFADVPLRADCAGDPADGVPGDLRGPHVCHPLFQHERHAAYHDRMADRPGHHRPVLHSIRRRRTGGG